MAKPQTAGAAEGIRDECARAVQVLIAPILRRGLQIGEARPPAVAHPHIAADVTKDGEEVRTVQVVVAARKRAATPHIATELDEQLRRRHPLELNAVVGELSPKEGSIGQRGIDEVPGMLVLRVEVADVGGKSARPGARDRGPTPAS